MNPDLIKTILQAVESAALYSVADRNVFSAEVEIPTGNPDHAVLCFRPDGGDCRIKFTEGALSAARVHDNRITAVDDAGKEMDICLYDLLPKAVDRKADINLLVEFATEQGLHEGDLDDLVNDCASGSASEANTDGLRGQMEWLLNHYGSVEEARTVIADEAEKI